MKRITIIFAALLFGSAAFAQRMTVGPKVGVNFSNLTNVDHAEALTGLTAGGFFVYSIIEHFGVSADLLYSAEGAKYTTQSIEDNIPVTVAFKSRINYLRVPILANVFFGSLGDRIRPKVSFGPSFGFLMGIKNSMTITSIENGNSTVTAMESTEKKDYSGMDLSAIVGAGLNFKLGELTWLNLDGRYSIGATDIFDVDKDGSEKVKNNSVSVALGLGFAFGEK